MPASKSALRRTCHRGPNKDSALPGCISARALVLALTILLVFSTVSAAGTGTADAISGAQYPTVMKGARGPDVVALQYLLNYHGYSTTVDGVFGSGTESKVEDFQGDKNLTVDGIVGPGTWAKLKVTVSQGSSGNAVRAVQYLLNAKADPDNPGWSPLTVDGSFGSGTKSVVKSFQTHAGLTSDGVVGTNTWKNLLWHYTRLKDSHPDVCIHPGNWSESRTWGVGAATAWTMKAADLNNGSGYGDGDIAYQDSSLEHGGDISGHGTHEVGMDLDVWLVRKNSDQCNRPNSERWKYTDTAVYDQAGTERQLNDFVEAASENFASDGKWIKLVYFNDPDIYNSYSFVYYLSSHDNHMHVRYCTAYYPGNSNYDC